MASWGDVDRVCADLPETTATVSRGGDRQWRVGRNTDRLSPPALAELAGEAWACRAPARLAARHRG